MNSTQRIHDAICEAVLDHRLPPGTKLKEEQLAQLFGVSRTIVRQTLIRLSEENIVDLRVNRGAQVAQPSIDEARQIFEARHVVEEAILRRLVSAIKRPHLRELRALRRQEKEAVAHGDASAAIRLSGAFHLQLAAFSGNQVFERMLNELVWRTSLLIALYEAPGKPACLTHDHSEIIAAMAAKDADKAVALMHSHLADIEARLDTREVPKPVSIDTIFGTARKNGKAVLKKITR